MKPNDTPPEEIELPLEQSLQRGSSAIVGIFPRLWAIIRGLWADHFIPVAALCVWWGLYHQVARAYGMER